MEFGGTPLEAVIRAIAQDRFAVCDQIREEVVRVLTRKFGWEAERVRADLAFYWLDALPVELKGTVTGICRDPKDETDSRMRRTRGGRVHRHRRPRPAVACFLPWDSHYNGPRVRRSQISASSRSIAGAHRFPVRSAIDSAVPLSRRTAPSFARLIPAPGALFAWPTPWRVRCRLKRASLAISAVSPG